MQYCGWVVWDVSLKTQIIYGKTDWLHVLKFSRINHIKYSLTIIKDELSTYNGNRFMMLDGINSPNDATTAKS